MNLFHASIEPSDGVSKSTAPYWMPSQLFWSAAKCSGIFKSDTATNVILGSCKVGIEFIDLADDIALLLVGKSIMDGER